MGGESVLPILLLRHLGSSSLNPFKFKVIIDKYDPIAIYFVVLGLSLYTFSVFPV